MAKLSIYKYVRSGKGWRYSEATFHPNGKIKPDVVIVDGREEKHFGRELLPQLQQAMAARRQQCP